MNPPSTPARLLLALGALALLAVFAFCVFGFFASFEPMDSPALPWRIGYSVLGLLCLGGAFKLLRRILCKP